MPTGTPVVLAAVTTSLDVAFARARRDPTRGISKERSFLAAAYREWETVLPGLHADVILDTTEGTALDAAAILRDAIDGSRVVAGSA